MYKDFRYFLRVGVLIRCSKLDFAASLIKKANGCRQSFAQADSLYQALGVTMSACTTSENSANCRLRFCRRTRAAKSPMLRFICGGKNIIVTASELPINSAMTFSSIKIFRAKYCRYSRRQKLFRHARAASPNRQRPIQWAEYFPSPKLSFFGGDKIISYQLVGGKGMSEKSYLVYDIPEKCHLPILIGSR